MSNLPPRTITSKEAWEILYKAHVKETLPWHDAGEYEIKLRDWRMGDWRPADKGAAITDNSFWEAFRTEGPALRERFNQILNTQKPGSGPYAPDILNNMFGVEGLFTGSGLIAGFDSGIEYSFDAKKMHQLALHQTQVSRPVVNEARVR